MLEPARNALSSQQVPTPVYYTTLRGPNEKERSALSQYALILAKKIPKGIDDPIRLSATISILMESFEKMLKEQKPVEHRRVFGNPLFSDYLLTQLHAKLHKTKE